MIIGLTGYFAAGKSEASRIFKENNFFVIDVDKLGHQILENPEIKQKLLDYFGSEIVEDNKISRQRLGSIVFQDKSKRQFLNSLVHPKIKEQIKIIIQQHSSQNILIDAALLFEMNLHTLVDFVLFITADESILIKRGKQRNNFSEKKIKNILIAQKEFKDKEKLSHTVITNNTNLSDFQAKIKLFIQNQIQN